MTGFLRQRAVIDLSRVQYVTVRGVDWVSDAYMMARADLFRTPPKTGKYGRTIPAPAAGRVLRQGRGVGAPVTDARSRLTGHRKSEVRLLRSGRSGIIGVNGPAAAEWLSHEWAAITQAADYPAVVFWQKRRGRLTVAGLIMPVYIGDGTFGLEPLDDAA